jgi:hypothetical protein
MIKLTKQFFGHVIPAILRPLHVLLDQVVGFFFACLTAWAAWSRMRYYRQLDTPQGSVTFVILTFGAAVLLLYLTIASFWKARKTSRS